MKYPSLRFVLVLLLLEIINLYSLGVTVTSNTFSFPIVSSQAKAIICLDKSEESVVYKAAGMFQADVLAITNQKISIQNSLKSEGNIIVAGTLGNSKLLKQVLTKYNLNVDSVVGKWEAFSIQIVARKSGNILVVAGSDRRGTAYGILELSRLVGISPWIWWADVKPTHKDELALDVATPVFQKPSVQYRGIFLNDEDWGLKPWASKNIEPEVGEIGPKTYHKIFELLLRLRANTIWPAMHECSMPFYFVKGNAAVADSFGIVVSTSHCEPMMRSNPREWNHDINGAYNFFTNKTKVVDYWTERLKEVSKYENVYTVGMRGIHDGAMEGANTVPQQVAGLTDVFTAQRQLLVQYVDKTVGKVPQIFIPYKEVLDAYNAGLKVPEDVTLVWCDDNYGYLTRLSNAEEQKRKGGSGVYYHISYWGRPHDYLWLATTQPAFIWTEMHKAWEYGARKMWILNVGDIKPAEYLTEFYLDMAWDINSVKQDNISKHLEDWMGKTFGNQNAKPMTDIMNEYYRLAFIRKPEFMGWSQTEPETKVRPTDLNSTEFGDELATRLQQYDNIEKKVLEFEKIIPSNLKSAYFELLKYPVCGAAEMNKKWLNWQYANSNLLDVTKAEIAKQQSLSAYERIQQLTNYYNDSIENGKWKYSMSFQPRKLEVFRKPTFEENVIKNKVLALKTDSSASINEDYVRLNASQYFRNNSKDVAHWQRIDGLGYSRSAMLLQPFAAKLHPAITENPSLEYEFYAKADSANIFLYLLPIHDVDASKNVRVAVCVDGSNPEFINIYTAGRSTVWRQYVLRNQAEVKLPWRFKQAGKHTLRIYAVDSDMILDQLLIDFKLNRKFYGVGEL